MSRLRVLGLRFRFEGLVHTLSQKRLRFLFWNVRDSSSLQAQDLDPMVVSFLGRLGLAEGVGLTPHTEFDKGSVGSWLFPGSGRTALRFSSDLMGRWFEVKAFVKRPMPGDKVCGQHCKI